MDRINRNKRMKSCLCSLGPQADVAASEIGERVVIRDACRYYFADDYRVISAGVSVEYATLDMRERVFEQRRSGVALHVADAFIPVLVFGSELAREVFLVRAKDVDGEVAAFLQVFVQR